MRVSLIAFNESFIGTVHWAMADDKNPGPRFARSDGRLERGVQPLNLIAKLRVGRESLWIISFRRNNNPGNLSTIETVPHWRLSTISAHRQRKAIDVGQEVICSLIATFFGIF